eukprot:10465748-Ditylum_brightwellii.AAC.1
MDWPMTETTPFLNRRWCIVNPSARQLSIGAGRSQISSASSSSNACAAASDGKKGVGKKRGGSGAVEFVRGEGGADGVANESAEVMTFPSISLLLGGGGCWLFHRAVPLCGDPVTVEQWM